MLHRTWSSNRAFNAHNRETIRTRQLAKGSVNLSPSASCRPILDRMSQNKAELADTSVYENADRIKHGKPPLPASTPLTVYTLMPYPTWRFMGSYKTGSNRVTIPISHIRGLITPLIIIATLEPPSKP